MKKAYFTFIFSFLFLFCSETDHSEEVINHYVSNQADLNQFASEILKYEKINSMSFGAHFIQTLNGSKISLSSVTSDTSNYKFVLGKYQVSDSTYFSFYDRLDKLRFFRFEYKQNTITFLMGSKLDKGYGLMFVKEGKPIRDISTAYIIKATQIEDQWYYYEEFLKDEKSTRAQRSTY